MIQDLKKIKLFLTDVDGVLTDGGMCYSESGDESKKFNTKDGGGLLLLQLVGIKTGIITQENTNIVKNRAKKLHIDYLKQNAKNKVSALYEIIKKEGISLDEVAYIGDDINDIDIMTVVGFSFAVSDACDEIKQISNHITSAKGGHGAVREACEFILKERLEMQKALSLYLNKNNLKDDIGIIIQVRVGSSRLPEKCFLKIGNVSLISHVIEKLKAVNGVNKIILATTTKEEDMKLIDIANNHNILSYSGSENDVLERFIGASDIHNINTIIRVCADNFFIDINEINRLLKIHLESKCDYTTNIFNDGSPVILSGTGFGVEIIDYNALKKIKSITHDVKYTEHITSYIYTHPKEFKINFVKISDYLNFPNIRLTIDTKEDYQNIHQIFNYCENGLTIQNVIDYVNNDDYLLESMDSINQKHPKGDLIK